MKHLTHRERIQTYTGLISAAGTLIVGPIMFVYSRGYDYPAIRLNPVFFLLIGLVSGTLFLMSSFRYTKASRRLQIILLWISGCAVAIESTPGNISSFLFLAAGLGLSIEYEMAEFRRLSVAGLVGALYLAATAISLSMELPASALGLVIPGHIIFGSTIGVLLLLLWKSRIEAFRGREESLSGLVNDRTNELERALEERGDLIKEIHHRVKNNMQLTSSLLQLTMHHTDSPEIREELGRIRGRVEIMGLVHHGIYKAGKLSRVALEPYLSGVLQTIDVPGYSRPDLRVELPEHYQIDLDVAVPLGLVVHDICAETAHRARDAVSRGVSPERPAIGVSLSDAVLLLRFEEHTHRDLQPDSDTQTTTNLELQIISGLCEQMGGTLRIETVATSNPSQVIVRHSLQVDTTGHSHAG